LHDADGFDAEFFGVSPREAVTIDPQQRLLLEVAWEAFERAGIDPLSLRGSATGVYAGLSYHDYGTDADRTQDGVEGYLLTGTAASVASGRVAYTFGLQGPAVTVDTACSSSLVALHLAVQSLRAGECSLALAGGVTLMATTGAFVEFSRQRGLAPDGRCKSFGADADGTGWGEGVGLLVLQLLSDARRDGNRVLAVVRGSAVNSDGASNGLTAPSGPAQERMIRQTLANAGLVGNDIDAVEGHGTGTMLGDPIEVGALLATYGQGRPADRPLWLGSVKSNIAHTQAAAGVAGVIKMVMAMQHGVLPPTLHAQAPNPQVDWSSGAVRLLNEPVSWPGGVRPRRVGISAFGIGGTNAHVIMEDVPPDEPVSLPPADRAGHDTVLPWVVSARGTEALRAQARRLAQYAQSRPDVPIADIGTALVRTRAVLSHRAVVVGPRDDLLAGLAALAADEPAPGLTVGAPRPAGEVAFLFSGQGAQWPGMAAGLYTAYRTFETAFDEVCSGFDGLLEHPLRDVVFAGEGTPEATLLRGTGYGQPALFAVGVALFHLVRSWGVRPDLVGGHSIGEIAAAQVAGVWNLADACALVAARARLMQGLPEAGSMVSVEATEDEMRAELLGLADRVDIAAVNGPTRVVIAGDHDAVSTLAGSWQARGRRTKRLPVSHAFHSPLMEPMLDEFASVLGRLRFNPPAIPVVSNLTGEVAGPEELSTPDYWVRHVRNTVRFADGVRTLRRAGVQTVVDLGPDGVLSAMGEQCGADGVTFVPLMRRGVKGVLPTLNAMGRLFVHGVSVDWAPIVGDRPVGHVSLPTYPFQHTSYWLQNSPPVNTDPTGVGLTPADHPLLGAVTELADLSGLVLSGRLSVQTHPWLADHVVMGAVVLPGTAYVDLAVWAGDRVGCGRVAELSLQAPLVVPDNGAVQLQVVVGEPAGTGQRAVTVYSRPAVDGADLAAEPVTGADWTCHATGALAPDVRAGDAGDDMWTWPPPGAESVDVTGLYPGLAKTGVVHGPVFQGVRRVWRRGDELFAEVALPSDGAGEGVSVGGYGLHPALWDGALHAVFYMSMDGPGPARQAWLPFVWSGVRLAAVGANALRVKLVRIGPESARMVLADGSGELVVSVASLAMRPMAAGAMMAALTSTEDHGSLYAVEWSELAGLPADGGAVPDRWVMLGDGDSELFDGLRGALPGALTSVADLAALADAVSAGEPAPDVVITLAGEGRTGGDNTRDVPARARAAVERALESVRSWITGGAPAGSRLVVLTSGAVAVDPATPVDLVQAPVWGLVGSAQSEHPDTFVLVDVDADAEARRASMRALPAVLRVAVAAGESRVAVRAGAASVPRMVRTAAAEAGLTPPADGGPWRVDVIGAGTLENLALVPCPEVTAPLEPGQVRVSVRAAGLNFRDVLIGLGMYPGLATIGSEAAGIVSEVGPGVTGLRPGDPVMGLVSGALGPVAVTDERMLVTIPAGWSFSQAASVPLTYVTAFYALHDLGALRAGERVLVHAGAGGVGMAAIQLARHYGAEVYATASTGKWDALRAMGLPDDRIASSRTLDFRPVFLDRTGGRGVDLVLNSLAGEFVDASLGLLPRGGRFLEMGKADVRDAERMAAAHPGVIYVAFDAVQAGPDRIQQILRELIDLFRRGVLTPPPITRWDIRHAPEAFRFLAQGRNIGKVVLTVSATSCGGGTVLVAGGGGLLGGLVARRVVAAGARGVVLVGRRGGAAPGVAELADELREMGAWVRVAACDVADRDAMAAVLAGIPADRPLTGVVHAAGVLDDGLVESLDADRLATVLRPKVDGAWQLHELTAGAELEAFVLFSSAAGVLGAAGQAGYAAGNVFLDALARHRRAAGLAAQSLAWGAWAVADGSGMAGGLAETDRARMARSGIVGLTEAQGLRLWDTAFAVDRAAVVPMRLQIGRLGRDGAAVPPMLRALARTPARRRAQDAAGRSSVVSARFAELPDSERVPFVTDLVRQHVAVVLGHGGAAVVPVDVVFRDLGFDSLTAVELRNRLQTATGLQLASTLVFDHPTVAGLARHLVGQLEKIGAAVPPVLVRPEFASDVEPIAIVGMACRFPGGVRSPEDLWRLVRDGVDAIDGFPTDRGWDLENIFDPEPGVPGRTYARDGGFVDGAADFDAGLFGISPREATALDPQQRLLLETAWETFERAGIDPMSLRGSQTGVFAGLIYNDYLAAHLIQAKGGPSGYLWGSSGSVATGRIAYTFGLRGPAITVDTACSSSLVTVHLAAQSLRQGECSLALAGGVTIMSTPSAFVEFSQQRGLSPSGRCRSYGAAADGTGWGEGIGLLLLERLRDARHNGHRVLAVVRGSAVNQDGASNGLAAPSGQAQAEVIRRALANAGVSPAEVDAVEGHGTGTRLGDPIEVQALISTYGQSRPADRALLLGSVKSNIGHTQGAAGVAGVIKMVLALRHDTLPATLHAEEPTPAVEWSTGAVRLLTEARPWPRTGRPRLAGVSSFGISGTNAHVIVADPADVEPSSGTTPPDAGPDGAVVPWVVSARDGAALREQAQRLGDFMAGRPDLTAGEVGASLVRTRATLARRAVLLGTNRDHLLVALRALANGEPASGLIEGAAGAAGKVAFAFAGQGGQWPGMAAELSAAFPVFAAALDEVCASFCGLIQRPLREGLLSADAAPLDRMDDAGPALFAFQVALCRLFESWGVRPDVLAGHSSGEIAAAYVAGVWELADACQLVAARGRLLQALPAAAAMVVVRAGEAEIRRSLEGQEHLVGVAAVNSPSQVVISGDRQVVQRVADEWRARGRLTHLLPISRASHSPQVDVMLDEFAGVVGGLRFSTPRIAMVSTVTGALAEPALMSEPGYWVRNVRETVRFVDAVRCLAAAGVRTVLELGPDGALSTTGPESLDHGDDVAFVPAARRGSTGPREVMGAAARLFVRGADVTWPQMIRDVGADLVELPTYAFQRQRFWLSASTTTVTRDAVAVERPIDEAPPTRLRRRLARAPRGERDGILLELVRTHLADVLGHASAGDVPPDAEFRGLGFDSLTAVEFRNRIHTATGLRLQLTVVFDYPTVEELAAHLSEEIQAQGDVAGDEVEEAEVAPAGQRSAAGDANATPGREGPAVAGPGETILGLYLSSLGSDRGSAGMDLLRAASRLRPTSDAAGFHAKISGIHLRRGDGGPAFVCFVAPVAPVFSTAYSFFAAALPQPRDVWTLRQPGFGAGEALPIGADVVFEVQADAALRCVGDDPFVLLGHSFAGWIAYGVADRLEHLGRPPTAVVMVDTYRQDAVDDALRPALLREQARSYALVEERTQLAPLGDQLVAMGGYVRMFEDWRPGRIATPTLLIRAAEPLPGTAPDASRPTSLGFIHDVVEVPGNHFTMMSHHPESLARAAHDWVSQVS
jgi:acyl transferase domain-containing protein